MREDGTMKILRNHGVKIAAAAAFAAVAAALFALDHISGSSKSWHDSLMKAVMATIAMAIVLILTIVSSDWFDDWMESRRGQ